MMNNNIAGTNPIEIMGVRGANQGLTTGTTGMMPSTGLTGHAPVQLVDVHSTGMTGGMTSGMTGGMTGGMTSGMVGGSNYTSDYTTTNYQPTTVQYVETTGVTRTRSMSSSSYSSSSYSSDDERIITQTTETTTTVPSTGVLGTAGAVGTAGVVGSELHATEGLGRSTYPVANDGTLGTAGTLGTGVLPAGTYMNKQGKIRRLKNKLHRKKNRGVVDANGLPIATGVAGTLPVANDLAANPGLPGVESYREGKGNLYVHKATNQTHFNEPILNRGGPGYTNGDLYDQPGYIGTESHHFNPIDKIASVIVGQKYTHEPILDRAYAEPNHMGPIDRLAHKLVGHKGETAGVGAMTHSHGNVLPTTTAMPTTTTVTKTTEIVDVHHPSMMDKIKAKVLHRPLESELADKAVISGTNPTTF